MKINLIIESREMNSETVVTSVSAIKKENQDSISYKYIDNFGKTSIEIFKNSAIISREGVTKSTMILKKGTAVPFEYKIQYINTTFDLFTKELNISEGRTDAVYVMYQKGELINEIALSIIEK